MTFRKFNDIEYPVPGIDTAIKVLRPGARWDLRNTEFVGWEDDEGRDPPTWDEIQEEVRREAEIYFYYTYEREREKEYPQIKDQLDMLFHDMKEGLIPGKEASTWFARVKSVKEKYPKPENSK